MLCGVQLVGAGEGYEVVEKQAAAAGRLRKKARVLARRTQPCRIRIPPTDLINPSPALSRVLHSFTVSGAFQMS